MNIIRNFITFSVVVASILFLSIVSFAQTISLQDLDNGVLGVNVSNPEGIAGAAFTLEYDTNSLSVAAVESEFFETFSTQQTLSGRTWSATSVTVDGSPYDQALVWEENNIKTPLGIRVAGARYTGAPATHPPTLFTVTFQLKTGATAGSYPIQVRPTQLCNPDAGYGFEPDGVSPPNFDGDEDYDPILDYLVSGDLLPLNPADTADDVLASGMLYVPEPSQFNLDVDGNGVMNASTDGELIKRFISGFHILYPDTWTNGGVIAPDATRTKAEIETFLETNKASLDVDGNGSNNASTDGELIKRFISGFHILYPDTWTNGGVIAPDATRTKAEIEDYLNSLKP